MSDGSNLWEKYKNLLNKEIHIFPRASSMEKEGEQSPPKSQEEDEKSVKRKQTLRKAFLVVGVILLMAIAFGGGYLAVDWYLRVYASGPASSEQEQDEYGDWKAYQNETYHFKIRYPVAWEVKEIKTDRIRFKPVKPEGSETAPKDYIFVRVTSAKSRAQSACEKDYEKCSFYANGIFGERTTTPEADEIFFGHGKKDFTLTLYKFDSDEETIGGYIEIFERLAGSFRFLGEATRVCEAVDDCVLAIRIDKCCSCFEAVSKTELKANSSLVAWEAGKDYASQKLVDCTNVYCSPCPEPSPFGVECIDNLCWTRSQ